MARTVITTVEALEALPPRSIVVSHFEDNSQPDFTAVRSFEEDQSGAASGGFSIMGTESWLGMIDWEGVTLTVEYDSSAQHVVITDEVMEKASESIWTRFINTDDFEDNPWANLSEAETKAMHAYTAFLLGFDLKE